MIRRLLRRLARWWDAPDMSDRWMREMRAQQELLELQPPEPRGERPGPRLVRTDPDNGGYRTEVGR